MKRALILSVIIFVSALGTCFTNAQSVEKETRDVSDFTKISFGVAGNLYITFGREFKVVIEGNKNYINNIETKVSGDRLIIKKENWRLNMNEKADVYITMPEIRGLNVSGSGRAEIKDAVKTETLNLSVSGSGKLYTSDILTESMDCSISGSGDILLGGNGNVSNADVSISGSGGFNGETTKIGSLDISISGSGGCRCYVTESLKATVSGSGSVTYLGNPKVDARISGSGRVRSK